MSDEPNRPTQIEVRRAAAWGRVALLTRTRRAAAASAWATDLDGRLVANGHHRESQTSMQKPPQAIGGAEECDVAENDVVGTRSARTGPLFPKCSPLRS
ncbi:hypothetical protein GCM10009562_23610 [Nocardioides aquaticus]